MPKQLIVTCDDFGVDVAVNEAVEQAFTNGILTSASLMMGGEAVHDAIERARRLKGLGVGLHITLADGRPVLSPSAVPALVDRNGRFRDGLVGVGFNWFFNPMARAQLVREVSAQFQAFVSTGLVLDHVNVHKHLHLHPTVAAAVIRVGRRYGALAIRVPDEPRAVLQTSEPGLDIPKSRLGPVLWLLRRRARRARLIQNDAVFGLAWSGDMTEGRLLGLIPNLPEGLNELYSHPATKDAAQMRHAVPTYKYREELKALLSPKVRQALIDNNVQLTRFAGPFVKG